jgi:hypothetical protein
MKYVVQSKQRILLELGLGSSTSRKLVVKARAISGSRFVEFRQRVVARFPEGQSMTKISDCRVKATVDEQYTDLCPCVAAIVHFSKHFSWISCPNFPSRHVEPCARLYGILEKHFLRMGQGICVCVLRHLLVDVTDKPGGHVSPSSSNPMRALLRRFKHLIRLPRTLCLSCAFGNGRRWFSSDWCCGAAGPFNRLAFF